MNKQIFFFCFSIVLLISCNSTKDTIWEMDTYIDMTLTQVIELLGAPNHINKKIIDSNYFPTPVEPPYYSYFSKDELDAQVTIAKWILKKENKEILVWCKDVNNDLIVFTSKKQAIKKNTRWRVYL